MKNSCCKAFIPGVIKSVSQLSPRGPSGLGHGLFVLILLSIAIDASAQTGTTRTVDFAKEVHPVLAAKCRVCHTGSPAQAGLRTDTREELLKGGSTGPAILPGKGAESLLILRVTGQKGPRMPPSGPPLNEDEIAVLRRWIDQGASWTGTAPPPERIAPIAPRKPEIPAGAAGNPIDRLIGLSDPPRVSDAIFARRAYLDLWGLPPSPEELQAFDGDRAGLIDRLLANRENYAEHWISFWNDLLRNDEGVIYHGERKSITPWLLGALRTNMPYHKMVQSLLNPSAKDDPEGFLVGVNWRGVVSASQSPPMQAAQNSAQVFLGMNLKCAACHDSFVNRWKLRDTYGLAAMFSNERLEMVRCDLPTNQVAGPAFPISELKAEFDETLESRQAAAAALFTSPENGRFARTIVNRYWRLLFGRAVVEPLDDMDQEPWSQDLLDWLASDFVDHGYDLQHLLRRIMTSRAYQMPAVLETEPAKQYRFQGPYPRRLSAEQFQDAISIVSGDWRIRVPRTETYASYTREWRLKSDPLSRALGRPIRDQVYTERNSQPSTLQALEMTNGPLLSERLERASRSLLGIPQPAPANLFDSKLRRSGSMPVDIDVTGAKELWLVIEDVDSYDPARIIAGWTDAEMVGRQGAVRVSELEGFPKINPAPVPSVLHWSFNGPQFTRFRANAVIDEESRKSEISPAIRFFVFTEKPDPERMVRIEGDPPTHPAKTQWTSAELANRLYLHLFARTPAPEELATAKTMLGDPVQAAGLEDLLWAMLMSPEFQFIQ